MFAHVSVWGVLLGALSAMVIGALWYSPAGLFTKQWSKLVGTNNKQMREKMSTAFPILIVVSLLTAYALSLVTVYLHHYQGGRWIMSGVEAGLLTWAGFAGTSLFAHSAFDPRDKKVLYINTGNRLVTLVVMGLIVGAFLK